MACSNETFDYRYEYMDFLQENLNVYLSIIFMFCVLVVLNNLVVIIVITKTKLFRKKHNMFVLSLAVCDFLIGIVNAVQILYFYNQSIFGDLVFLGFLLFSLILTSILNVAAVAVERSLALVFMPLRYSSEVTTKRLSIACIILWVVPLATQPFAFFYNNPSTTVYLLTTCCLFSMIATAVFYVLIYKNICKSDERLAAMGVTDVKKSKKILKTFSIITGLFIVSWSPHICIGLISVSFPNIVCSFGKSYYVIFFITHLNSIAHSMINPLIYWCRLSDFRIAFSDTFGRCGVS
ncbi:adenosine receptor A2b-like [Anneissia japonica]|uniref:adenosine receptor A2b-like n=1 Tax=Anneissia japonica TaxID=1529436 RepID=UPI0014259857|nr:adenosine receptor A2b-like [Anneissia japonica]